MIDFIFMLTRNDQTVPDCLEVLDSVAELGLAHVGFKDLGVPRQTLVTLNERIKETGAMSYLEVVSTTPEDCVASAQAGMEIGVDRIMGGTQADAILDLLADSGIEYLPFAGEPTGHPTALGGSPASIEADCRRYSEQGCAGVDLLAYRATEADPLALVKAARRGTDGFLVVAGSIDCPQRVRGLADAGVDAFTIGTAALQGTFSPGRPGLSSQLQDILAACR